MLPIKKIYIDSRHCTSDSKRSSDFIINLPMHSTLLPNTFITALISQLLSVGIPQKFEELLLYTSGLTVLLVSASK